MLFQSNGHEIYSKNSLYSDIISWISFAHLAVQTNQIGRQITVNLNIQNANFSLALDMDYVYAGVAFYLYSIDFASIVLPPFSLYLSRTLA